MRFRHAAAALVFLLLTGCSARQVAAPAPNPGAAREIIAILQESAVAWNHADLEGFLRPYAPEATS